jgi:PAS domain S-box-containing protein
MQSSIGVIHPVITVSPQVQMTAAIAQLTHAQPSSHADRAESNGGAVGCLVVVDHGQIVGLLTERDVLCSLVHHGSLDSLRVQDVMATEVVRVHQAELTSVEAAIALLHQHATKHLVVVEEGDRPLGIITSESVSDAIHRIDAERKQRDVLYQQSEQQFRKALDSVPTPIAIHSENGEMLYINPSWTKQSGYTHEEIPTVQSWVEKVYGDRATTMLNTVIQQLYSLTSCYDEGEFEITVKNGEPRTWSFRSAPLGVLPNGYRSVITIATDVTVHIKTEAALRDSEQRTKTIIETIPDLLILMDRHGNYQQMSGGSEVHVKYPSDQPDCPSIYTVLPPEMVEERLRYAHQALATRTLQVYEQLFELEGDRYSEEVRIAPLNDNDVLVMIRDVTAQKEAEAALRASEERYRAIYEQAAVGLLKGSLSIELIDANPWFCELTGYSREELLAKTIPDIVHPEDYPRCQQEMQQLLSGNASSISQEKRYRRKDGTYFWSNTTMSLVRDIHENPLHILAIIRNITAQKEAEAQLQNLIAGTATTTGDDFFPALVKHLSQALDVDYAIATEYVDEHRKLQTLGVYGDGALQPNFAYEVAKTPCEQTLRNETYYCEHSVQDAFPDDDDLVKMGVDSYLGVSMLDLQGNSIGHLCILDRRPLGNPQRARQILSVFAARASVELERRRAYLMLEQANQDLIESIVTLRQREQFLQTVLNTFPLAVFWKDINGHYQGCNDKFLADSGYPSVTEVIGKTDFDMPWAESFAPLFRESDQVVIDSGEPILNSVEVQVQRDGQSLWVEKNKLPIRDIAGRTIVGVLGTYQDITQRKQAEEQLQNLIEGTASTTGSEFFPAVVRHVAQALNVDGAIATELRDGQLHTLAFWIDESFVTNPSHHPIGTPCEQVLDHGTAYTEHFDYQQYPEESYLTQISASCCLGVALLDTKGESIGTLSIFNRHPLQNLSRAEQLLKAFAARASAEIERQRATASLEQLNQTLEAQVKERTKALALTQTAVDMAVDAVLMARRDGSFSYVNQAACAMSGYTPDELLQRSIFDLDLDCHPDDWHATWQHQATIQTIPFESRHCSKTGKVYPVEISKSFIQLEETECILLFVRDITRRKHDEQERQQLLQELSDFKFAFDQSAIFAITDPQGIITHVNERFCKLSGYSKDELIGQTHRTVNSGYHPPEFFKDLWNTVTSGRIWRGEICNRKKDGQLFWVSSTIVPLLDEHHQPIMYLAIRFDITDRKLAEQTIRRQVDREKLLKELGLQINQSLELQTVFDRICEKLRSFMRTDRVSISQVDAEADATEATIVAESVDPAYPAMLGTTVREQCCAEHFEHLSQEGRYVSTGDIYQHPPDTLSACYLQRLEHFQIRASLVVPIHSGDALLGLLFIDQCNAPRTWQQGDIDIAQQVASQLAIAIQQVALYQQLQQELVERQRAQHQLTERNQELAISNEELARATRLKDEFLANMSHELRTPLNAILGLTEGLQDGIFGPVSDRQASSLKIVYNSGQHLLELINDILDIAKIESGQIDLSWAPTSVESLCESSLIFVKQQATQKQIRLQTRLAAPLPVITVDGRRIRQVLINLLNNAVKFTPSQGTVTLEASVQESSSVSSTHQLASLYVKISIIDTGIGIATEHLSELFQPFRQIDSTLSRNYEGTGLGLALVKRLVELHHGRVTVTSEVGVGSCFSIELPCEPSAAFTPLRAMAPNPVLSSPNSSRQPNDAPSADPVSQPPASTEDSTAQAPLILLAEDNEANVSTLSSYLNAKGYRITIAKNGLEAVSLMQTLAPDIVLMDIQMPGMDGLSAIRQIRHELKDTQTPIIALTALAMSGDRDRCLAAGANDYISKPVTLRHLASTIQNLLNQRCSTANS